MRDIYSRGYLRLLWVMVVAAEGLTGPCWLVKSDKLWLIWMEMLSERSLWRNGNVVGV